ncbi:MAG: dephospho-CoA kinase [Syntrophus sp. (in: bacteria)]|nr:dephospho-CoA kinase [Syntrophus sp. (in: bacteria)]
MITIGITGIIGSGKTTVSNLLKQRGLAVVDLDGLAREAITLKEVQEDIINSLGKEFVKDGKVVVEKLRDLVFVEKEKLEKLESIVHPKILEGMWKEIDGLKGKKVKTVIIDGPLLYEKGLYKSLNKTIVVSAGMDKIKERLKERGLSEEDMDRRISLQVPLKEKEKVADFVIFNNGTKEDLEREAEGLWKRIKEWEVRAKCTLMI